MAILYVIAAIGYILKAQAETPTLQGAPEEIPQAVMPETYIYMDGKGGLYKEWIDAQSDDIQLILDTLKGAKEIKDASECQVKSVAPGLQDKDIIMAVELKCKEEPERYVKIMVMTEGLLKQKKGKFIAILPEPPKKVSLKATT